MPDLTSTPSAAERRHSKVSPPPAVDFGRSPPVAQSHRSRSGRFRAWRTPAWFVVGATVIVVILMVMSSSASAVESRGAVQPAGAHPSAASEGNSPASAPESPPAGSASHSLPRAITAQNDPDPSLAPNQVDLGITVATLTINYINSDGEPWPFTSNYLLHYSWSLTDPTNSLKTISGSNNAQIGNGCSSPASCGSYSFSYYSGGTISFSIGLWDQQLGGQYAVNIDVDSNSVGWSGLPGVHSSPVCVPPTGCNYKFVGSNSNNRHATVDATLTVESVLLTQIAAELEMYSLYTTYLGGLEGGNLGIVCPGVAEQLQQPVTPQQIAAAITGIFLIMTLGLSTIALLGLADVEADTLLDIIDYASQAAQYNNWGTESISTYPAAVAADQGLHSIVWNEGYISCGNLLNFYPTLFSPVSRNSYIVTTFDNDFTNLRVAAVNVQSQLQAGSLTGTLSAISTEESRNIVLQSDASTMVNDLENLLPGCNLINDPGCTDTGDYLAKNIFAPFYTLLQADYAQLQQDYSLLSSLLPMYFNYGCNIPSYSEEGAAYTTGPNQLIGGIGPYGAASQTSWLSVSQPTYGYFTLSGTAPSSYGSYWVGMTGYDNVGDSASCGAQVQVGFQPTLSASTTTPTVSTTSVTFSTSIAGGPGTPYTYSYWNLPNGCSSVNQASFSCTPVTVGTYNVFVTVTDKNGHAIGSNTVTITVKPGATYSFTFNEKGLPSGDTWSVTVNGAGKSATAPSGISFGGLSGSEPYTVNEVLVSDVCGIVTYYAPSPASGTLTGGGSLTVTYTEYTSGNPVNKCIPSPNSGGFDPAQPFWFGAPQAATLASLQLMRAPE